MISEQTRHEVDSAVFYSTAIRDRRALGAATSCHAERGARPIAAYNSGHLHGKWIGAEQEAWYIYDDVKKMLGASRWADAEGWAIQDYEGFEGISIEEYDGFDRVAELAAFVVEHGKLGAEVFSYFRSIEEARSALTDQYAGQYESLADFA